MAGPTAAIYDESTCFPEISSMASRTFWAFLALGLLVVAPTRLRAQEPPTTGSQSTPPTTTRQTPPPDRQERPRGEGRRGRGGGDGEGREGRRRGRRGGRESAQEKKPRRGIKVTDPVTIQHCGGCHKVGDDGLMSRVSFMRKGPEGWEMSLKRMIRHHDLQFSPQEARQMIRYLAHHHGLARGEAERGLYDAERRVHWSEAEADQELRQACAPCHTLGRVFSQQRTAEEWQHLKKMHMAFYPISSGQFGERRGRRGGSSRGGFAGRGGSGAPTRGGRGATGQPGRGQSSNRGGGSGGGSRADRVLAKLTTEQALFSPEWEAWQVDEREVPLAGMWTVIGHEVGRGEIRGTLEVKRTDRDAYTTVWSLEYSDGTRVRREGRGVMYAGYSWRGRSRPAPGSPGSEPAELREVMLLSEDWNTFKGRCFHGGYSELGTDVTLHRHTGATQVFASDGPAIAPSRGSQIVLRGTGFPADAGPRDFHLGAGITVTDVRRENNTKVTLVVDIAKDAKLGKRRVSFRAIRGPDVVTLYDTIDYVKVAPTEGFSRVGGGGSGKFPKQYERFEAWAMHRGPDKKLYTKDDWKIKVVPAKWHLEEFAVHEYDDDAKYVGSIDADTGFFTPAIDGPNPKRRWNANNIGNVYVVAEAKLTVPVRPPEPKKPEKPKTDSPEGEGGDGNQGNGGNGNGGPLLVATQETPPPVKTEEKAFKARGHLLVTVPLYVMWERYEWDHR